MKRKKKHPEPFYRSFAGAYYVQLGKEQIRLAKGPEGDHNTEATAWRRYHEVMAERGRAKPKSKVIPNPTVTRVCNEFLDHAKLTTKARTYEFYRGFIEDFCGYAGGLRLDDLEPAHLDRWLARHPKWKGCRRGAVSAVKRAFNYMADEGRIDSNPLKRYKKPAPRSRERFLTPEERKAIFDRYPDGDCFRDFLFALEQTACRPGEVAGVTSEQVNLRDGLWVFEAHKTADKTGKPREVLLTPAMVTLTERLMAKVPPGTPLFRDSKGEPWNRNSVRCRFRRVRTFLKLGSDVVAYLYRHAVCTDLLESGAGVAQAAEILGHTDTKMVMRHYSKLRQRREHLREQVVNAVRARSA